MRNGNVDAPARGRTLSRTAAAGKAAAGRAATSRHRPWWKWLVIGALLAFSLAVTILYGAALIPDLGRHRWAAALDASRDAVPALVGWAALIIVVCTGGGAGAERILSADSYAVVQRHKQAARDRASAQAAAQRVQDLTAKLAELTAARAQAGPLAAPDLDRELAGTRARLDQSRQWLSGARAALAASRQAEAAAEDKLAGDFPEPAERRGPAAGRPA